MQSNKLLTSMAVLALGAGGVSAAHADIVVVANAKNANALSKEQIAALYLGDASALPDGSAVTLAAQESIREAFYTKCAGRTGQQAKAVWARIVFTGKGAPPKEMKTSADVKAFVASDPRAIGYIDAADADDSVKVLLTLK